MRSRVTLNLVFFAVLGVVMTIWAVSTIISINALDRPFRVTAEFTGAPGMRPDLEVAYLGVRVGKVGSVELETGKVAVVLEMDRDVKVPSNVGAQVLRKSAIGEPYIDLSAPTGAAGAPLEGGDHIPLSRTSVAVEYKRLFDGAASMLRAVRPEDARILTHELAVGLDGRSRSLRDLIADAHQLTGTLAANAALLDQTSTELTRTTVFLAAHRTRLVEGADSLAAFTEALRAANGDLTSILDRGPAFLTEVDRLVTLARPGLSCLLTAAGVPAPPLFTRTAQSRVHHSLVNLPVMERGLNDVLIDDPNGPGKYLRATFVLSIAGPTPAAEYAAPVPRPVAPPMAVCPAPRGDRRATAPADVREVRAPAPATSQASGTLGPPTPASAHDTQADEPAPAARYLPMIPVVPAALVLLLAIGRALAVATRRR